MTTIWAYFVTITLNLAAYPLFQISDGNSVYMETRSFRVALGGSFATEAACQAYSPPAGAEFVITYADPVSGAVLSVAYPLAELNPVNPRCQRTEVQRP